MNDFIALVKEGFRLAWNLGQIAVESVKAASEVYAPVSGEVVEVNASLRDHPERVNKDPHAAWMIRIRPSNAAEADALLDSAKYEALLG